jgi:hypothetical protein
MTMRFGKITLRLSMATVFHIIMPFPTIFSLTTTFQAIADGSTLP